MKMVNFKHFGGHVSVKSHSPCRKENRFKKTEKGKIGPDTDLKRQILDHILTQQQRYLSVCICIHTYIDIS